MMNKIFLLLFTLSTPIALSTDTLQQGQNITDRQNLVSSNSVFELGFFSLGSCTKCFVGIWFTFSTDVVVWVANRDSPLNNTSRTLAIDDNGSLVLYGGLEKITWPSTSIKYGSGTIILQLQDSGNLILKEQTSNTVIWQNFDHPTNTLLPGMKLGKKLRTGFETYLSSWKSGDDPSTGNYSYKMDTEGAPETIIWDHDQITYRSGMWNGLYFSGQPIMLTYTNMFTFLFAWSSFEVTYEYTAEPNSSFSRIVLDESGIKRRLVWDLADKTWNEFLVAPQGLCDNYAKCGPFGVCQSDAMTLCNCLRGFEPAEPNEWDMRNTSTGCKRKTPLNCSSDTDGFYVIKEVKLPYSHEAIVDANISVKECESRCLMNCSCLAYAPLNIKEGSGCVMWNTPLIDIKNVNGGQDLYVKISKSELSTSNKISRVILAATISIAIILVLTLTSSGYLLWRKKMKYSNKGRYLVPTYSMKETDVPVFNLETILHATCNFSITNKLGEGGFGIVYKGQLPGGQDIAVKRLSRGSSQRLNEFMNEVLLIAKLQHRNLVRLRGCCIENNERMLIYEFMANKSLDYFIFDATMRSSLNWKMRFEIIIGIARGLLYLHQDSRFNIIHRDLKAANILLDEDMNPKISDFGTARLFIREQGEISTETVTGTRGYMSPEYAMEGKISVKSDVYSFGVLLLEIISGKRNKGNQSLLAYVWKLWEDGYILKLLDEALEISDLETDLLRCIHVGLLCVQECPDDRPSMSSIFTMLSSNMVLQNPKKPFVSVSIRGLPSGWSSYEYDSSTMDELTITRIEGR